MEGNAFIGGLIGGMSGILSSYPLDTLKVRMQMRNKLTVTTTTAAAAAATTATVSGTFKGLYKGVSSPLIGSMFINSILFGVEEKTRHHFMTTMTTTKMNKTKTNSDSADSDDAESSSIGPDYKLYAISGAIAGFTQSFLLSPIELIKIKMQLPNSNYSNTFLCARDLLFRQNKASSSSSSFYSSSSIRNLMRGTWLTVARDVPAITIYFISFEYFCNLMNERREKLNIMNLMISGGTAGCLSWLATYPIDVVKTRYQADLKYASIRDCLTSTYKTEGMMGFWRGLSPTLIRAFPNSAATFATIVLFNRYIMNNQWSSNDPHNYQNQNCNNYHHHIFFDGILIDYWV